MSFPDKFTVAALPLDIKLGDIDVNLERAESLCTSLPQDIDLVVLPELFTTAFIGDPEQARTLAETDHDGTIARIKALAAKYHACFCGSFLAHTGQDIFNRGFIIEPDGEAKFYNKRHLFCISEESKLLTRGEALPPVVRFRRWNISISICYDLRFPVWMRNVGTKYDLMVVPANWPDHRAYDWEHLLMARAIENECYVIGCNRTGSDPYGTYHDSTLVVDYTGKPIGERQPSGIITARLNKAMLDKFRNHKPFLADIDDFSVKLSD